MPLLEDLSRAKTEEDVKDAYIKALGLKKVTKGLVDIRTDEVWFEAKHHDSESLEAMFTQLLHYVQAALNAGEALPQLLAVIDTKKAAIMKTSTVLPVLSKKTIKWGKSATKPTADAVSAVAELIATRFVAFRIENDAQEFITTVKAAIKSGEIIRTQITPDNLKQVFDKWVEMIGREASGVDEADYALLFFADAMSDGDVATHRDLPAQLLRKNGKPVFQLGARLVELASTVGYDQFWAIYDRPPAEEHRNYLLERRDSLIPVDERGFKGAFYTPLHVVDKAYEFLRTALGARWQQRYIVWDMCCGVGNLEVKHSNHRQLFMSTLDQEDVDVMVSTRTCAAAHRFQYDYLNDDIAEDGSIDYSLSDKVPPALREAIASGQRILVLINPPYAEAMRADNVAEVEDNSEAKVGVAATRVAKHMDRRGYASRELFTQFLIRIARELPTATIAIFSKLKYVNAPNFEEFRTHWNAEYRGGFVVHSKAFDGLKGDFPIGFLIWASNQNASRRTPIASIETRVLNKNAQEIGIRSFHNVTGSALLGEWIERGKPNDTPALPLKSAISPTTSTKDVRGIRWTDGGLGGMICKGSDMQNAAMATALLSSGYCSAGGILVNDRNLWQIAVAFAVRLLIKHSWQNDRDQLLAPTSALPDSFRNDCLVWMLFHNNNLTASADGLDWNGQRWSLVNHFIPYTEQEVGSTARFESNFTSQYLAKQRLSSEAKAVLDAGRPIWKHYFDAVDPRAVRERLKLNRPDVGWYQVRTALKERQTVRPALQDAFRDAYQALGEKLRPDVYTLGFLRA